MADFGLLLEAERRGILPPEKQGLLDEARRRGLVSGEQPADAAPAAEPVVDVPIAPMGGGQPETRTAAEPGSPAEMLYLSQNFPSEKPTPAFRSEVIPQGMGGGVAMLAGAPTDMATTAVNSTLQGSEYLSNIFLRGLHALGADVPTETPYFGRLGPSMIGSQNLERNLDLAANQVGIPTVDPAKMTDREKMAYNVSKFGTGAAVFPGATIPDVVGGAGAGAGLTVADPLIQKLPDSLKPLAEYFISMVGAMTGARTSQAVMAPKPAAQIVNRYISTDPVTGAPRATADRAAEIMQQKSTAAPAANAELLRNESAAYKEADLPTPPSGSITADPGLLELEQRARLGPDKSKMVERDRQVNEAAGDQVRNLVPEADTRAPGRFVQEQNQQDLQRIQQPVDQARNDLSAEMQASRNRVSDAEARREADLIAREQDVARREQALAAANKAETDLGAAVESRRGGETAASTRVSAAVDEAKAADEAKKAGLYSEAETLGQQTKIDPTALAEDAKAVRATISPLAATSPKLNNILADLERLGAKEDVAPPVAGGDLPAPGPAPKATEISATDLIAMRPRLSAARDAASQARQGDVVQRLDRINGSIEQQLNDLAAKGDPAAVKWQEAEANFKNDFAPKYREGVGGQLDQAERSGSPVPPSAVGERFLKPGAGGKEAADDLNRILADKQTGGPAAARDYVLSDMAKVVGSDGKINPLRLRNWIADREGMFSAMPGLRAEVDDVLKNVTSGSQKTSKLQQELTDAVTARRGSEVSFRKEIAQIKADNKLNEQQKAEKLADVEDRAAAAKREVETSVASLILGKEPRIAAADVFASKDPATAMRDIVARLKQDKSGEALAGWKKAVQEHLENTLTGTDSSKTIDPTKMNLLPAKVNETFKKHEATLAEVYSPEEMNALQRVRKIAATMQQRSTGATVGSSTVENQRMWDTLQTALLIRGNAVKVGMQIARIKAIARLFPNNRAAVDQVLARAQLNPELAAHLLDSTVPEMRLPAWNKDLSRLLGIDNALVDKLSREDEERSKEKK